VHGFPDGFFDRDDPSPDPDFYAVPRLVTHLDDRAVDAVGALYDELGVDGDVLDLMSSWVSHLRTPPRSLTVLGLNAVELAANPMATARVVHDLNADPRLPFADASFDAVVNCVSVDYLVEPAAVLAEVARVLRPGGLSVCTFSNRCFPTKAVRGWLAVREADRPAVVAAYHRAAGGFEEPTTQQRLVATWRQDPLWAVWARRRS
jgi:SAM-dependent methyltransferase